jgi:hypothetical protein
MNNLEKKVKDESAIAIELMENLIRAVKSYRKSEPTWGKLGDLQHINEVLRDLNRFGIKHV